ncbi:MAG: hypothetical protein WCR36_04735 [Bacteroidaceae bacterium]
MSNIEEIMRNGLTFKGAAPEEKREDKRFKKVKTKAKKATYISGQHGSGSSKMKAEIRQKRANRHR